VPSLEIIDETVIVVTRERLAAVVADRSRWSAWWPDLEVTVLADLGLEGMRWAVAGPLVGVSEVRLQQGEDGVLVRYVLEADPTEPGSQTTPRHLPASPRGRRELVAMHRRRTVAWKRTVWALKDEFEASRSAGPA
jgi:hypothetical protein